jgi:hypothetical protein
MGGQLFISPLTAGDVFQCFLISAAAGFSGGITACFFHPMVVKDRKLAALLTLLLTVLGLIAFPTCGRRTRLSDGSYRRFRTL